MQLTKRKLQQSHTGTKSKASASKQGHSPSSEFVSTGSGTFKNVKAASAKKLNQSIDLTSPSASSMAKKRDLYEGELSYSEFIAGFTKLSKSPKTPSKSKASQSFREPPTVIRDYVSPPPSSTKKSMLSKPKKFAKSNENKAQLAHAHAHTNGSQARPGVGVKPLEIVSVQSLAPLSVVREFHAKNKEQKKSAATKVVPNSSQLVAKPANKSSSTDKSSINKSGSSKSSSGRGSWCNKRFF